MSLVPSVRKILPSLLLVALPLLFGTLSFQRKVETFQPLGFELAIDQRPLTVRTVEPTDGGLVKGDQILLVNTLEVPDARTLRRLLRQEPESTLFVLRGDEGLEVQHQRLPLAPDYPYLILALLGLAYLGVGLYTLFRDGRKEARLFYFWCLASSLLYLLTALPPFDVTGKTIYVVEEIARLLLPALTLHLFLTVPRPESTVRRRRWIAFLYLPGALLAALQADLMLAGGRWLSGPVTAGKLRLLDRLELGSLVLFVLASVAVLFFRWQRHQHWQGRRQAGWLAFGLAVGYSPFLVFYLLPFSLGFMPSSLLEVLAVLPLAAVPLTFSWAVLRFRLQDLGVLVRSATASILTVTLGVFAFSLLNVLIQRGVPDNFVVGRDLLVLVAGVLVAGVIVPARGGIAASLERLQYRGTWNRRRALGALSHELLHERNPTRLASTLTLALREAFDLQQVSPYLLRTPWLQPLLPGPESPTLDAESLAAALKDTDHVELSGLALPGSEGAAAQRLYLIGYRYLFPLMVRGMPLGLVAIGYKSGSEPLNSEDCDLLRQVLDQAALALESARLLQELHDQLGEVTRLERETEAIIEYTPAGLAVLDSDGTIHEANAAFARIVDRDDNETKGRKIQDVLPIAPLPSPGDEVLEVGYCTLDGVEKHLQVSLASIEDESRRVLVLQDVSDQVALRMQVKEKERMADLGMLAAGVAHEVNTPLTGISSYAQMLLSETPESDPRHEILRKVEAQTFRASRIVNDLLSFSRRRETEARPVPVVRMIDECLELLSDRFSETGVAVEWQPEDRQLAILGHEGELHQVFLNLIRNAIDAMTAQGGQLTLRIDPEPSTVKVTVEDDGPGIPDHQRERIFQPFVSTKLAGGGTGLGLAISYNIVRRHQGELMVESQPGQGCRFTVRLPRAGGAL